MTFLAARCLLVGASVMGVVTGVVVPLAPSSRVVVLLAAACCAVLDVAVVRSVRTDGASTSGSGGAARVRPRTVLPVATGVAGDGVDAHGAGDASGAWGEVGAVDAVRVGAGVDAAVEDALGDDAILLGRTATGGVLTASTRGHLVVVGRGALAHAVFRSVVEQVRSAAPLGRVRVASDPALRCVLAQDGEPCPPLPADTAALVGLGDGGAPRTTVVLVPGQRQLPRLRDTTIVVGRHGCTLARDDPTASGAGARVGAGSAVTTGGERDRDDGGRRTPFTPALPIVWGT